MENEQIAYELRLVVAITSATGAVYGIELLKALNNLKVETHLILSRFAKATILNETTSSIDEIHALASVVHVHNNQGATISSGSFRHDGMIIAPCSMKTLAGIRCGYSDNLILRAADVTLKERRRLVLLVRESPLNDIHLENMLALSCMGAVIMPPVPAFYHHPKSINDIVEHTIGRDKGVAEMTSSICPRCQGEAIELMSTSPIKGAWEVYICHTCFYAWRSTGPKENTNPRDYPVTFRLTKEEIDALPILPPLPPLRAK
jgi:polyprenyl P-hydroxybenzoate/phenylacrylic acid decarboxylase-like protein